MPDDVLAPSRLLDRFGFVLVAVSVTVAVLLLFDLPTRSTSSSLGAVSVTVLTAITLVLALLASGVTRPLMRVTGVAIVVFAAWAVISFATGTSAVGLFRVLWFLLVVATPFLVLRRLLTHATVTTQTLLGAASVYLLLAVMFMFLFLSVEHYDSGRFFGELEGSTSFMYFSLVTFTTLGYGDLTPVTDLARTASVAAAVTGQIYLVFIVARMVGLYSMAGGGLRSGPESPS